MHALFQFSYVLVQFQYFVCPVGYNSETNSFSTSCDPPEIFKLHDYMVPPYLQALLGWVSMRPIPRTSYCLYPTWEHVTCDNERSGERTELESLFSYTDLQKHDLPRSYRFHYLDSSALSVQVPTPRRNLTLPSARSLSLPRSYRFLLCHLYPSNAKQSEMLQWR